MASASRFDTASSSLALKHLLTRGHRALWMCLGVGASLHLSLIQIRGLEAEQKAAKPLTTQFVKRAPRLTKPLELKKRPQPKRRRVQREMVAVKAQVRREGAALVTVASEVMGNLAKPSSPMGRGVVFDSAQREPRALAQAIEGTREPADRIAMSLEFLDVGALDTGRYQAMVIQDPDDRRNIKGFLHLALAYPSGISSQEMWLLNKYTGAGLAALARAMNEWTGIRTDVRGRFTFNSRKIFSTPWIHVRYGFIRALMADTDLEALGQYALSGGFVFVDSHLGELHTECQTHRRLIVETLQAAGKTRGRDWDFERLPSSHPLYDCFFSFDGPPIGGDTRYGDAVAGYMEGVTTDGRMVLLFGHQCYIYPWCSCDDLNNWPEGRNTRQLEMGVNMLVFALTQEGSMTNRLMDEVR